MNLQCSKISQLGYESKKILKMYKNSNLSSYSCCIVVIFPYEAKG